MATNSVREHRQHSANLEACKKLRLLFFPEGMFRITEGQEPNDVINGVSCTLEQLQFLAAGFANAASAMDLDERDVAGVMYSIHFLATIARDAVNSLLSPTAGSLPAGAAK